MDARVLVLIRDERPALVVAHEEGRQTASLRNAGMKACGVVQGVAEAESDLAGGFRAGVEVLVEPASWRAEQRERAPLDAHHAVTEACRIGPDAELAWPHQRVAVRPQHEDDRAANVVVSLAVLAYRLVAEMPSDRTLSHPL